MTESAAPRKGARQQKRWLTVREMTVFSMLGAILFCSKLLMEWAPNIHFVAMFIITFTLVYRAKALIPVLVPLFVSSFRRADDLAIAMECRCYRGGEGRSRMTILKYSKNDAILFALFFMLFVFVILSNAFLFRFSF